MRGEAHAYSQLPVLLLELGYAALEVGKLGFPSVTGILGSDAVAVCASLLTLFWCNL